MVKRVIRAAYDGATPSVAPDRAPIEDLTSVVEAIADLRLQVAEGGSVAGSCVVARAFTVEDVLQLTDMRVTPFLVQTEGIRMIQLVVPPTRDLRSAAPIVIDASSEEVWDAIRNHLGGVDSRYLPITRIADAEIIVGDRELEKASRYGCKYIHAQIDPIGRSLNLSPAWIKIGGILPAPRKERDPTSAHALVTSRLLNSVESRWRRPASNLEKHIHSSRRALRQAAPPAG